MKLPNRLCMMSFHDSMIGLGYLPLVQRMLQGWFVLKADEDHATNCLTYCAYHPEAPETPANIELPTATCKVTQRRESYEWVWQCGNLEFARGYCLKADLSSTPSNANVLRDDGPGMEAFR